MVFRVGRKRILKPEVSAELDARTCLRSGVKRERRSMWNKSIKEWTTESPAMMRQSPSAPLAASGRESPNCLCLLVNTLIKAS